MKKKIIIGAALVAALCLAGCDQLDKSSSEKNSAVNTQENTQESATTEGATTENSSEASTEAQAEDNADDTGIPDDGVGKDISLEGMHMNPLSNAAAALASALELSDTNKYYYGKVDSSFANLYLSAYVSIFEGENGITLEGLDSDKTYVGCSGDDISCYLALAFGSEITLEDVLSENTIVNQDGQYYIPLNHDKIVVVNETETEGKDGSGYVYDATLYTGETEKDLKIAVGLQDCSSDYNEFNVTFHYMVIE